MIGGSWTMIMDGSRRVTDGGWWRPKNDRRHTPRQLENDGRLWEPCRAFLYQRGLCWWLAVDRQPLAVHGLLFLFVEFRLPPFFDLTRAVGAPLVTHQVTSHAFGGGGLVMHQVTSHASRH